ncbi:MAG: hypothetical protein AAB874_00930, partial [Patescibacteria group bacterium]
MRATVPNTIKSYYIDDDTSYTSDAGNSSKWPLNELNVANPTYPTFDISNSYFNNDGDYIVLFDSDGNIIDQFHYDDAENGATQGRSPDNTGSFTTLNSVTKGAQNSGPKPLPTPKPTATPKPTVQPNPTPRPTLLPSLLSSPRVSPRVSPKTIKPSPTASKSVVLGETEDVSVILVNSPSPNPSPEVKGGGLGFVLGPLFILAGIAFSGFAGFLAYRQMQK